jgi:hypothetical protein
VKGRNSVGKYPDDIQAEVEAACRENRPIELLADDLGKLGHGPRNPVKVIRSFCMDCMAENAAEVRRCTSVGCDLWPYRMGKNPFTNRKGGTFRENTRD